MRATTLLIWVFFILFIQMLLGGLCLEYVIESWATYFKGVPVDVALWKCMLASLFLAELAIPGALLTWILMLIIL